MIETRLRGLYAITDEKLIPASAFADTVELALKGGAAIVQYRDKSWDNEKRLQQAKRLRALCNQYEATLIINDDIALAKTVGADGVHLGEDDASIAQARSMLGDQAIIGVSCYNDVERAIDAESNGADYVAFGAMFNSNTKPNARSASYGLIRTAKTRLGIPVCAIGGIDKSNVAEVVAAGADMTALVSGLFSSDDVIATAEYISGLFD